MKTIINLEFLDIKSGRTLTVNVPNGTSAEEFAQIIRTTLHERESRILNEVYIDHEFEVKTQVKSTVKPVFHLTEKHVMEYLNEWLTPDEYMEVYNPIAAKLGLDPLICEGDLYTDINHQDKIIDYILSHQNKFGKIVRLFNNLEEE